MVQLAEGNYSMANGSHVMLYRFSLSNADSLLRDFIRIIADYVYHKNLDRKKNEE